MIIGAPDGVVFGKELFRLLARWRRAFRAGAGNGNGGGGRCERNRLRKIFTGGKACRERPVEHVACAGRIGRGYAKGGIKVNKLIRMRERILNRCKPSAKK